MKYILKEVTEPMGFTNWKIQEAERLSILDNGDSIWEYFPSSIPAIKEEGIVYYSKTDLKEVIVSEQGNLCCYCNNEIKNDHTTILEHLTPKTDNPQINTLNYFNILASCDGNERTPRPRNIHCSSSAGNENIKESLNPLILECEKLISFTMDGQVMSDIERVDEIVNTTLNLNLDKLITLREKAIKTYYYDSETSTPISREKALEILSTLNRKNQEGKYIPFCSAIKNVLEREIIGLAA